MLCTSSSLNVKPQPGLMIALFIFFNEAKILLLEVLGPTCNRNSHPNVDTIDLVTNHQIRNKQVLFLSLYKIKALLGGLRATEEQTETCPNITPYVGQPSPKPNFDLSQLEPTNYKSKPYMVLPPNPSRTLQVNCPENLCLSGQE